MIPTNLDGPNDNYDLATRHVFSELIHKANEVKINGNSEYVVWDSGKIVLEFLYIEDMDDD